MMVTKQTAERLNKLRAAAQELFAFHPDGTIHVPAPMFIALIDILLEEHSWQGDLGGGKDTKTP